MHLEQRLAAPFWPQHSQNFGIFDDSGLALLVQFENKHRSWSVGRVGLEEGLEEEA